MLTKRGHTVWHAAFAALVFSALTGWAPGPEPGDTPWPDSDVFAGGLGLLDVNATRWEPVGLELHRNGTRLTGVMSSSGGEDDVTGRIKDGAVTLRLFRDGHVMKLTGRWDGRTLSGTARHRGHDLEFLFVPEDPVDLDSVQDLVGVWVVDDDHSLAIRKSRWHLALTDFLTGDVRVLYRRSADQFATGHRFAVPHPVESRLTFERDEDGLVTRLVIRRDGKTLHARPSERPLTEEFVFSNDDLDLHGTLSLPPGPGPHPAIVFVHGSGAQTRAGAGSWPLYLTSLGFAVVAYDKRGQGLSGGDYALSDGGHDNQPHMRRRATDVLAAVRKLRSRDDIDATRVGLMGGSQAGWVMPMVAGSDEVAFTITLSGGATALSIENIFSHWASEQDGSDAPPVAEVLGRVRQFEASDPDFRADFVAQTCPGLWLYGGLDRSNPSRLCIELIEDVAASEGHDFTIAFWPDGNHGLLSARIGGAAESPALDHLVTGLHATIEEWLRSQGLLPRPDA